jgi:hypothetical protein
MINLQLQTTTMKKSFILLLILSKLCFVVAQRMPDEVFMSSIKTIKLVRYGEPLSYPIYTLNSSDKLMLDFDDLDGGVKNYFYTVRLCNADWTPAQLSYFDYVRGYSQARISTFRNSAISLTRYTHYQAIFPDKNLQPIKSGNYILSVFLNGDTSKVAFTKRLLVVDPKLNVGVQVTQPFTQQYFQSHHRLQVQIDTKTLELRYPQQQIKLKILQNFRWDNHLTLVTPTFIRPDQLQYSNEMEMLFPAGKEFRWLNLRSFRLLGDRVKKQQNTDSSFSLYVKEDLPRMPRQYFYYSDMNGLYLNETIESISPLWNADYAKVHFTYRPTGGSPFENQNLLVFGELSNYGKDPAAVMKFNDEKGVYETDLFLKQGYYDYQYATEEFSKGKYAYKLSKTENDTWETENSYMILVYFRQLGGRYDELFAVRQVNSQFNRGMR